MTTPTTVPEEAAMLLSERQCKALEVYTGEVHSITASATSAPLKSQEEYTQLSELLARGKAAAKGLDGARKGAVGPLNAQVKEINSIFRPLTDALGAFESGAKRLVLAWKQHEQAQRRRMQEEAQRREVEAAQREAAAQARADAATSEKTRAKALAEAEAASVEQMVASVSVLPGPAPRGLRTDSGSSSTRTGWNFKVMKPELVPREYLVVNEKLIREVVCKKDGVREIPGVAIYEEESLSVRAG